MKHDWYFYVYNGSPALKCTHCSFIWQAHMRKPKVSCEEILARKK